MRGGDADSGSLFSYVDLEQRVPRGHEGRFGHDQHKWFWSRASSFSDELWLNLGDEA